MILLLLVVLSVPLRAEIVRDLYSAQVRAEGRGQQALQVGARDALAQVLVKVSGSQEVLSNPAVRNSLSGARNLVQRYSFVGDNPDGGTDVRFDFDGASVVEIVTSAGEPLWTANRPTVLAWVVLDGADGLQFISRDSSPEITAELQAAFSRRGVPLQLPLFDLADTAALRPQEVARLNQPAVELASRRYNREFVLAGRLQPTTGAQYSAQWVLLADGDNLQRAYKELPLGAALDSGAGLAADTMSARFAVAPTAAAGAGILISVSGVESYGDYAAVVVGLEGIELIDRVGLVRVAGDRLQLRLQSQVNAEQLAGIIAQNARFEPVPSGYAEEQLSYQWRN